LPQNKRHTRLTGRFHNNGRAIRAIMRDVPRFFVAAKGALKCDFIWEKAERF